MLAQVIVDVPLMQTDKPYSYQVPEEFSPFLEKGMRVHVPFGKGNRLIQGIVVGLEETTLAAQDQELKSIVEVLDYQPVLGEEQFWLADQLRKTVFAYKITLLKAMLPSVLNSSYDKILHPTELLSPEDREDIFGTATSLAFSSLDIEAQARMMRLTRKGELEVEYQAVDRKHIKTEKWYRVNHLLLENLDIAKNAKKRLALRDFVQGQKEEAPLRDLLADFSRPVVNYFIDQGALLVFEKEVNRAAVYFKDKESTEALVLNAEQEGAVQAVTSKIGQPSKPFLLEGVTGSGKTEVYLQIIQEVLEKGKTAIMLVPEISLTPQVTDRFISRFGDRVAILHSGLSNGEKYDEWRRVERGEAQVVVGARSAIFAPLKNLGAIIIDEEHEATYKQDSNPRYHAREVALLRAQYHQAVLVLGSATPSLETRARAGKGVYEFLQLTQRANPLARIPEVEVIDFRDYIGQQESGTYTPKLLEAIAERLQRKEQVVLMLNRRGYSSFVMCRECGQVDTCPNCDISLTLHMDTKTMDCHYCNYHKAIPTVCPNCQSRSIRYYGTGTQMIAKGLDFPNVTLVGVLNADTALNLPDFRSSERTFQLLTQVAGRAGRADKEGQVLIQTYNPHHYAIEYAKRQDYEGFYAYEMKVRRQLGYPPYYYTVGLTLSHKQEEVVVKKAYQVMDLLKAGLSEQVQILGPTPKPIARTHNLYHYQILLKYRFEDQLPQVLNQILDFTQERENQDLRVSIDNEPQSFM